MFIAHLPHLNNIKYFLSEESEASEENSCVNTVSENILVHLPMHIMDNKRNNNNATSSIINPTPEPANPTSISAKKRKEGYENDIEQYKDLRILDTLIKEIRNPIHQEFITTLKELFTSKHKQTRHQHAKDIFELIEISIGLNIDFYKLCSKLSDKYWNRITDKEKEKVINCIIKIGQVATEKNGFLVNQLNIKIDNKSVTNYAKEDIKKYEKISLDNILSQKKVSLNFDYKFLDEWAEKLKKLMSLKK